MKSQLSVPFWHPAATTTSPQEEAEAVAIEPGEAPGEVFHDLGIREPLV